MVQSLKLIFKGIIDYFVKFSCIVFSGQLPKSQTQISPPDSLNTKLALT